MSGFNFSTKGGFGAMLANTQGRQINEAVKAKEKSAAQKQDKTK